MRERLKKQVRNKYIQRIKNEFDLRNKIISSKKYKKIKNFKKENKL